MIAFEIWQRGWLSLAAILGGLFINAFWNGIVSVFVMVLLGVMPNNNPPQGAEWWGLFFFLIPFEVIGLIMFAVLVLMLLEPFRRTAWKFEQSQIERTTRWPLVHRRRTWEVLGLDRLELRSPGEGVSQPRSMTLAGISSADKLFELAFVTTENADLCSIGSLTEGEARWMARAVLDRRPSWLARPLRL